MPCVIWWESAKPVGDACVEQQTTERDVLREETRGLDWIAVGDDWDEEEEGDHGHDGETNGDIPSSHVRNCT